VKDKKYSVESTGPRIEEFLNSILKLAGIHVKPEPREPEALFPDFENPDIRVEFTGPDVELLLANKAELLLALEQLTLEMLGIGPREHSLIAFDANDHRLMRLEELRLSASTVSDRVRASHVPYHFSPMTSRERRIIHLAVTNQPGVRSESVGIGPQRGVVVYPADMPSPPATAAPAPPFRRRRR